MNTIFMAKSKNKKFNFYKWQLWVKSGDWRVTDTVDCRLNCNFFRHHVTTHVQGHNTVLLNQHIPVEFGNSCRLGLTNCKFLYTTAVRRVLFSKKRFRFVIIIYLIYIIISAVILTSPTIFFCCRQYLLASS